MAKITCDFICIIGKYNGIFLSWNLGKDLFTTIKKKTLSEENVPFDFVKSTLYHCRS